MTVLLYYVIGKLKREVAALTDELEHTKEQNSLLQHRVNITEKTQITYFFNFFMINFYKTCLNIANSFTSRQLIKTANYLIKVIFAIEGDIQRIGPRIFLCTPKNIGVSGSIALDEEESEE